MSRVSNFSCSTTSHKGISSPFYLLKNHGIIAELILQFVPHHSRISTHVGVIVCYLTKFLITQPFRTKNSREILDCLQERNLTLGKQKILQHDQGLEFSLLMRNYRKIMVPTKYPIMMMNGLSQSPNPPSLQACTNIVLL